MLAREINTSLSNRRVTNGCLDVVVSSARTILSRRGFMMTAAAAMTSALTPRAAWATPNAPILTDTRPLAFEVSWSGFRVGTHVVRFDADADRLLVKSEIKIAVDVLVINLMDFHLVGEETWRNGRLVGYDSKTVKNGRTDTVHAVARDSGLEVNGRKGRLMAPANALVASFWNADMVRRPVVINPHKGTLKEQELHGQQRVDMTLDGETFPVTRYRLTSIFDGFVDYDDNGRWRGAQFEENGGDVVYRPLA